MITALFALAVLIAGTAPAYAGFLVAPVVAALGITGAAATVLTTIGGAALAIGASYLASKLLAPETQRAQAGGTQLDIRVDADVPESLILGRAVTAGSLAYAETFGKRGDIDNSDLIEIFALADHPCEGLAGVFVEEEVRELDEDSGDRGQVVGGFGNKLAVKFFDGSQTAADAFTVDKLGTHPERPWTNQMVGRGRTYIRAHSIYGRERVPGQLRWRFVVDGARLYDPRKDTSVGGDGDHRWDDLDTHEFTTNLIVFAYNILRGVRVENADGDPVHFYGLEGTRPEQLPLDVWFAAMNEADVLIDDEPQFHGGAEISVDTEPREVLLEIMKACDGRFVEVGGVYKVYVGAPMLPVLTIDDGVLRADEGDSLKPIKPLTQRVNHVTGKYTSPEDGWIPKIAPARTYPEGEARDGRRVSANLDAPMIQADAHMQRIMQQMLNRARKERRHNIPLPAACWGLVEPGRFLEWDSERNGYDGKVFEIEAVDDDHNFNLTVTLTEVDEDDYDWNPATDLIPTVPGSLVTDRPAPQVIDGFNAVGFVHTGDNGTSRPAILVSWDDPENEDLVRVVVQLRRPSSPTDIVNFSTDEPAAEEMIILAGLAPFTDYEVRGRFISENGYDTEWSIWTPVTTPDARIGESELDAALDALLEQLRSRSDASLANALEDLRYQLEAQLAQSLVGSVSNIDIQSNRIVTQIGQKVGANEAAVVEVREATATDIAAFASVLQTLIVKTDAGYGEGLIRFEGVAAPEGVAQSFSIQLRATLNDEFADTGFFMDAGVTALGGQSRIRLVADKLELTGRLLLAGGLMEIDSGAPFIRGFRMVPD